MIPDPSPPFEIGMSDDLKSRIAALIQQAYARGIGDEVFNAVSSIMASLRVRPRKEGDPIRHLDGMNSMQFRIMRHKLIVHYTVDDRIPMVTIWRFELASDHPLAPPPPNRN
jgi:hypothetical protein